MKKLVIITNLVSTAFISCSQIPVEFKEISTGRLAAKVVEAYTSLSPEDKKFVGYPQEALASIIHGHNNYPAVIGAFTREEKLVGYACLYKKGINCSVAAIFVTPEKRGDRIGRALLNRLLVNYSYDYKTVTAAIHQENVGAHQLFESLGFKYKTDLGCMDVYSITFLR